MTPTEALETVRYQVAEDSANFWSNTEVYGYLTQGERELASQLECNEAVTAVTVATGTYSYSTGVADFVNIKHVTYSGDTAYKLKATDFRGLQSLDDSIMTSSATAGDPEYYWRNGNAVVLWPTPDASGTISVYGTKVPTAVVSGAAAFTVPVQFSDGLPDYALYRMYLKDQDDSRANMHLNLWREHKQKSQREWMRRRFADQFPVVKDEGQYPSVSLGIV
jgi:hypothetical protein